MINTVLENQLQMVLDSCPRQSKNLAIPLIASLLIKGDRSNIELVKQKLGTSLYNHYCELIIDKAKESMSWK